MPNKTDRILSYLPGTFRVLPKPVVLHALVDAFGQELLTAENSLAEVMTAHWVDYADRGAATINDLEKLAALYGLAPLREGDLSGQLRSPDEDPGAILETVEEFREHLKRYIRIFLDGTVTVQGMLRVAAEALFLRIADTYEEMDCWWNRSTPEIVTVEARRDNAAHKIFGNPTVQAKGHAARAAQIKGTVDLRQPIALTGASLLRLKVDQENPVEIDLAEGGDASAVSLAQMVERINQHLGGRAIAHTEGTFLTLTSPTRGPASHLEILDGPNDAAERVLGLVPLVYRGSNARPANITGSVVLSATLDLTQHRYLRLEIDRTRLVEIDCAGANPDHPDQITPQQVCDAINQSLNLPGVATVQDQRITLTSPTVGFSSSIAFQRPSAQDATAFLFGPVATFHIGQDAQAAKLTSRVDLNQGVDLSDRAQIRFRLDGSGTFTVNCAGADPKNTQLFEIVNAINEAAQGAIASQDGRFLTIQSPRVGATSLLALEPAPAGDATDLIFGFGFRTARGAAATAAELVATPQFDEDATVNLLAEDTIALVVDGGTPVEINLAAVAADLQRVTLPELENAINKVVPGLASVTQSQLVLTSPTAGGASSLAIAPLETVRSQRFVTRTPVLNEATQAIFGVIEKSAEGAEGQPAQLMGTADLSRGVDLTTQRYLRLQLDTLPAIEIDCAGQRPRVTTLPEVVEAINLALKPHLSGNAAIASHDGQHLILTSPTVGDTSRIALEAPQREDARPLLLGASPDAARGQDENRVTVIGTVDLSKGINLPAQAAIKLGVDGAEPVTIPLTGAEPARKALGQLLITINTTLDQVVAQTDGKRLILFSGNTGETSRIVFAVPDGSDVTADLFGFSAPRTYQGAAAQSAEIVGQIDRSQPFDLETARFLRITVDTQPPKDVDCTARKGSATGLTLDDIRDAINTAFSANIASHNGTHLIVRSPSIGLTSRIAVEPYTSGDARPLLLGTANPVTEGVPPTPAVIASESSLISSVNLSKRSVIRLSVDGDRPLDIDVAGVAPANTFADEIVEAINRVYPRLASVNDEGKLQLTSPTPGLKSSLALVPLRYLELIEYPATPVQSPEQAVRHGDRWFIDNPGAAEAIATIILKAPHGAASPTLVNTTTGWQVRLRTTLSANDGIKLQADGRSGIRAYLLKADGTFEPLPASAIAAGPIGQQIRVPFAGELQLTQDANDQMALQLNNPQAAQIVRLRALSTDRSAAIAIQVRESAFPLQQRGSSGTDEAMGRVRTIENEFVLMDEQDHTVAILHPGSSMDLSLYVDQIVVVHGRRSDDEQPAFLVQQIQRLFDVTVRSLSSSETESYSSVTIGDQSALSRSLTYQLNAYSRLIVAEDLSKGTVLSLPQGHSTWRYLDCYSSRFNQANFDQARFPGKVCYERGIFNISRFTPAKEEDLLCGQSAAVFVSEQPFPDPPVQVQFEWDADLPGSVQVNLPADLPPRFGGRFNQTRFSQEKGTSELYTEAVLEETENSSFNAAHALIHLIQDGRAPSGGLPALPKSNLVRAERVDRVPLGWKAIKVPFRKPQPLTLGRQDSPARLYLQEEGVAQFLLIEACDVGEWGNDIRVSVRPNGKPAMYDVAIAYHGSRFENARAIATGSPLPTLTQDLLKPGPFGVLQAKAAGVQVTVTRDACQ